MVSRQHKNVYTLKPPEMIQKRIESLEVKAKISNASQSQQNTQQKSQPGVQSQCSLSYIEDEMTQSLISIKTKKHKSLGVLTLIFIKLFLQRGPLLSLDEAADWIFEEDNDGQSIFKSKSRRLYDIANVLKSLGIIKKQKNNNNKNVFLWIGSSGFTLEKKGQSHKGMSQSCPNHSFKIQKRYSEDNSLEKEEELKENTHKSDYLEAIQHVPRCKTPQSSQVPMTSMIKPVPAISKSSDQKHPQIPKFNGSISSFSQNQTPVTQPTLSAVSYSNSQMIAPSTSLYPRISPFEEHILASQQQQQQMQLQEEAILRKRLLSYQDNLIPNQLQYQQLLAQAYRRQNLGTTFIAPQPTQATMDLLLQSQQLIIQQQQLQLQLQQNSLSQPSSQRASAPGQMPSSGILCPKPMYHQMPPK